MKKLLFLLAVLTAPVWCAAQETEPLILLNPGRETFINFPSQTLPGKTVTFFLPQQATPLTGRYPVVYVLGAIPKNAPLAQAFMDVTPHKALVVGINLTPEEMADAARVVHFFKRELIPYVDTNYPTLADASHRAVAAQGTEGGLLAYALLYQPELFTQALLAEPDPALLNASYLPKNIRLAAWGDRPVLSALQARLENVGLTYGTNFVLREGEPANLFEELPMAYWLAPAEKVALRRVRAAVTPARLVLSGGVAHLQATAQLANGRVYDFYPSVLRMSPPYLDYNAPAGTLSVISGAEPATVKISGGAGKTAYRTKIRLKKQ